MRHDDELRFFHESQAARTGNVGNLGLNALAGRPVNLPNAMSGQQAFLSCILENRPKAGICPRFLIAPDDGTEVERGLPLACTQPQTCP